MFYSFKSEGSLSHYFSIVFSMELRRIPIRFTLNKEPKIELQMKSENISYTKNLVFVLLPSMINLKNFRCGYVTPPRFCLIKRLLVSQQSYELDKQKKKKKTFMSIDRLRSYSQLGSTTYFCHYFLMKLILRAVRLEELFRVAFEVTQPPNYENLKTDTQAVNESVRKIGKNQGKNGQVGKKPGRHLGRQRQIYYPTFFIVYSTLFTHLFLCNAKNELGLSDATNTSMVLDKK